MGEKLSYSPAFVQGGLTVPLVLWYHYYPWVVPKMTEPSKATERHYRIPEIATMWNLSEDSVRALFRGEPGVLTIIRPANRAKRQYVSVRVPQSVLERVHRRLSARSLGMAA